LVPKLLGHEVTEADSLDRAPNLDTTKPLINECVDYADGAEQKPNRKT